MSSYTYIITELNTLLACCAKHICSFNFSSKSSVLVLYFMNERERERERVDAYTTFVSSNFISPTWLFFSLKLEVKFAPTAFTVNREKSELGNFEKRNKI